MGKPAHTSGRSLIDWTHSGGRFFINDRRAVVQTLVVPLTPEGRSVERSVLRDLKYSPPQRETEVGAPIGEARQELACQHVGVSRFEHAVQSVFENAV